MLVWKRTVSIFNTEYELQEKHSLFLPFFNLSCRILPQNDIQRPVFIIQNELTSFQNGCIIEIDGTERGCFRSFRNQFSNFRIFYNKHTRKEDVILCVKQFVPCWVSLAAAFGGWNAALTTLVFFLSLDYLTGLLVAGVFRRSPKTKTGGLQSKIGWKGLVKKVMVLLLVLAAARMDVALHTDYLRNTVCIGFTCNELISILENAGLMGIPLPAALKNAVDLLMQKGQGTTTKSSETDSKFSQGKEQS